MCIALVVSLLYYQIAYVPRVPKDNSLKCQHAPPDAELPRATYQDNTFELVRQYKAIKVGIQILESLSKPLALQAFHELCKLIICEH